MITAVTYNEIKDTLMEPTSRGVKEPYFIIPSPETSENITVLASGRNGLEFNKTAGFFHTFPGVLVYRCLYGQGVLLIQKNDEQGEAKEVRVVGLRSGVEVEVPSGYGHTIINTGKNFLVTIDNAPKEAKYKDRQSVKDKRGLSYYVIDKKGEIGFEQNSNYKFHPQISTI